MPQLLKINLQRELSLAELGFNKMKDLILAMSDQVKIELRGVNHPVCVLIKNEKENIFPIEIASMQREMDNLKSELSRIEKISL